MENKKLKLSISGKPKKSFKNFEATKSQGKNSVVIAKSPNKFSKKGSSFRPNKTKFPQKTQINSNDFEKRKLAEQRATKRLKGNEDSKDKKTKLGQELLKELKIINALFITSIDNPNAFFSLRNIKNITVIDHKEINPYILMKHENVVIDSNVLEQIKQATIL